MKGSVYSIPAALILFPTLYSKIPHRPIYCKKTARGIVIKRLIFSLIFTCCFAFCCGCGVSARQTETPAVSYDSAAFETFCEQLFRSEVTSNTINLHFTLSDPQSFGISSAPVTLGTISPKPSKEAAASLENTLAALSRFDRKSLTPRQQLTWDVLHDYLSSELASFPFHLYHEFLSPSSGTQAQLPILYEEYRFSNAADVDDYLTLLSLTPAYFDQIIAFEQEKAAAGLFMSDAVCKKVIAQCRSFAENKQQHYLIESFNRRLDTVPDLSEDARAAYRKKNAALIQDTIFPAYDKLCLALDALSGSGKNDKGLCFFPDGTAFYESLVRYNTGSSRTIPEIQSLIEQRRAAQIAAAASLTAKDPNLWKMSSQISLPKKDAAEILNDLRVRIQKDFPKPPDIHFTVNYIDKSMEDYLAPAFYITAPIDNCDLNSIYINAKTDASSMRYFTTLAHEGFPGHLYQTVMSCKAGLPPIRSILNYPGYVEGWATYVEMLSYQYAGLDPSVAELLSLNQSVLLSLYASTDIGIHYEGWSPADTIRFWKEYGISNAQAVTEIYEYILSEPANYLRYYVGYLEFLELKDYAKEISGAHYSDTAFHRAVLEIGPAPFDIVKKYLTAALR